MRSCLPALGVCACLVLFSAGEGQASAGPRVSAVAVFPVENLTGHTVHADVLRQQIVEGLTSRGVTVLADAELEAFIKRHRIRYAAGLDTETAEALKNEAGVDGVVIISMALSSEEQPPKVALVARLVSTGSPPVVLWADDAALAGDDAPGLLELGLVDDYDALLGKAFRRIEDSLVAWLETGTAPTPPKRASTFRPKMSYSALSFEAGRTYSVAVLPFLNLSPRRNAGEMLASLFVRHLTDIGQFRVLDAGVVRRELLSARVIMDQGPSLTDAETVAGLTEADFVVGGRVLTYEDFEGAGGVPRVEFSAVVIERKSRKVVWSSDSYNAGRDGVRFFGRGASNTAHTMATQMVRLTTEMMAGSGHRVEER